MKQGRYFSVWIIMLCGIMILFTACSQTEETAETQGTVIETPEILTHVYEGEAIPLPEGLDIYSSVGIRLSEDRIKMCGWKDAEAEGVSVTEYYICEMGLDGSDPVITEIVLPEGVSISSGTFTENGLVFAVRESRTMYHLYIYDTDRGVTAVIEDLKANLFPDNGDPDWFHLSGVETDKDGYIYLTTDTDLCVLNPEGVKLFDYTAPIVSGLTRDGEGNVYLLGALGPGHEIRKINRDKQSLEEVAALPKGAEAEEYYFGAGYEVFYSNSEGLYGANTGMTEGELLVSWGNSNMTVDDVYRLSPLSAEEILAVYTDSETSERVLGLLKKAPDIDLSARTVLELAYVDENYSISDAVLRFNKKSRDARVVTRDYSVYNTKENNYTGGAERLMNDILNGLYKPDIVCGSSIGDEEDTLIPAMIEKGLYTDLYSLMEADMEADILGCVKNYYDVDGQLAAICDTFRISTLLAEADTVKNRTSWTLGEMMDFAGKLGTKQLLAYTYRGNAAEVLLGQNSYAAFVDMENHTCDFDSPVFMDYLNFIASLPADYQSAINLLKHETDSVYEIYQTGQSVLYRLEYRSLIHILQEIVPFNTPDVVKIGYPSEDGTSGVILVPANSFLITSFTEHPSEAWDFLREALTGRKINMWDDLNSLKSGIRRLGELNKNTQMFYAYQTGSISAWDGSMSPRELDENGTLDGKPGILVDFSMERLTEFVEWLDTVGVSVADSVPAEVDAIINEEVSAFLGGARSAEDTANVIQSRVSIWLAEHE